MLNIYVIGNVDQGAWARKYSPDGDVIWTDALPENRYGLDVDPDGNIYITGGGVIVAKYSQVPEPSTIILMLGSASSLAFAAGVLRRRVR